MKPEQRQQNHLGFTLIEVLVALMIVAMALMTGLKVSGTLVNNAPVSYTHLTLPTTSRV